MEWGCHPILAGEYYEEGFGCEANGETALGWYRRAADSSSVRGIMTYARCLTAGVGGPPAPELALEQYRRAAALGHTAAQVRLTPTNHLPAPLRKGSAPFIIVEIRLYEISLGRKSYSYTEGERAAW